MSSWRRLLLIIALTCMWSPSFLFIKLAIEDLSPLTIVTLRVGMATVLLSFILLWYKRPLPLDPKFWMHASIMAFFASVMPFVLFCYAEQTIESALAAIINGCSPTFTALLAHQFLPADRLKPHKVLGIALSAMGLLFLFAPNILLGLNGTFIGILAAATAAFCYAVSHVYAKKFQTGFAPFIAPTAQLLCSTLMLIPLALIVDAPFSQPLPSPSACLGVCGLSLFGTFFAFIIYYKLLEHCGPTAVSMVACFFPVGGMLLGFIFLGEMLSWATMGASTLIFVGLMIVTEVWDIKPLFARWLPAKEGERA